MECAVAQSDISANSTASSLLNHASLAPPNTGMREKQHDTSGSSFSSTSSQRVRIKAKYLKEIKSPFDTELDNTHVSSKKDYIPPALPGNRPKDYPDDVGDERVTMETRDRRRNRDQVTRQDADVPGPPRSDSAASELMEAVNTSGQSNKVPENFSRPGSASLFKTPATSRTSVVKQGAAYSGIALPSQWASAETRNDVRITQFEPTGRQRLMKEQLLKRQENSGPVKRYIQPKMINPTQQNGIPNQGLAAPVADSTTSVAAATAAAVAATAPIVKVQSDLEHKINAIMDKLSSIEDSRQPQRNLSPDGYGPMHELQNRLDEVTQLRLRQLEKMQDQQMEWQAKLLSAQQIQPNPTPVTHHPIKQAAIPIPVGERTIVRPHHYAPSDIAGQSQSPTTGHWNTRTLEHGPASEHLNTKTHDKMKQIPERTALSHGIPYSVTMQDGPAKSKVHHLQTHSPRTARDHHGHKTTTRQSPLAHGHSLHGPGGHKPSTRPLTHGTSSKKGKKHESVRKHVRYTPAITVHTQQSPQGASPGEAHWKEKDVGPPGMEHGTQTSPLDTPAPRRHPPVPLTQHPTKMSNLGRGLLEEILTSHDEEERENKLRNKQMESENVHTLQSCR